MSWFFYSKDGKLLYDVIPEAVGDADTLDGIDSTGFVRIGAPGLNIGDVDLDGSLTLPLNTLDDTTNPNLLDGTYRTILVDSSSNPVTITLPLAPLTGQIYEIRDVGGTGSGDSSTNQIDIDPNGNTIDGNAGNLVLATDGDGIILVWDGFKWVTLSDRTISPTSIDADTLDGIDSTQFLRSDVDDTAAGNITFSKSIYNPVTVLNDLTNPNLLDDTYRTVIADPVTNSAPVTITLPASPVVGQWYEIVDGNGGAASNNITIDPNGNFINTSGANIVLDTNFDSIVLVCVDATNWSIVSWRFAPVTAVALDDLSDVTITAPTDGELLKFDFGLNEWVNDPNITIDSIGILHLPSNFSGIYFGESTPGEEVFIDWAGDSTLNITGRTAHVGAVNNSYAFLENGVVPAGDTFFGIPTAVLNTLLCRTSAGDLYIVLPSVANTTVLPRGGDTLTIKDVQGDAGVNVLQLVAEGVRRQNVPTLQATSTTGTIADATTTTTPGGLGVDEVQLFQVTGSGTYEITFDGAETAAVLDETSDAATVQAAINSLAPHPNPFYGYFSVTVTGTDAATGLTVTFDGGALIDGESSYSFTTPYQSVTVLYGLDFSNDEWYLI